MRPRTLIACAALLGYRFDSRVLAACAGTTAAVTERVLREACRTGVLVPDAGEGAYRFRHALCRRAIQKDLDGTTERALHARIATALERNPAFRADAVTLAYHWTCAGNEHRALRHRERASAEARRLGGD